MLINNNQQKVVFKKMENLWNVIKGFFAHDIKNYFISYDKKYSIVNTAIMGTLFTSLAVFIDSKNSLSILISKVPTNIFQAFLSLGIILIILLFIKFRIIKSIQYPLPNRLDYFLFLTALTLLQFVFVSYLIRSDLSQKMFSIKYGGIVLIFLLISRILIVGSVIKKKKSTIVDLKEVINEELSYDKPFLIRETAAGYDLLDRKSQIIDLIEIMKEYNSEEKFVIGLEGAWGSGKSTFLKNMKEYVNEYKEFVIVDDFEPWLSENKEALLNNLLNTILMKSNLEISSKEIDQFIKTISELVLGKKYTKPIINILENIDQKRESNIISDINYIINRNGKKIIFIVDNLDRLKPDNIYLILNIVNNVLNFDNFIIILSYDEEELSKSLEKINISRYYLDKIIQKKVVLPVLSKTKSGTIYYQSFINLLDGKKLKYNSSDIKKFINILVENQVDFRSFKRFINSSVLPFIFNSRKISIIDYLVMEYIRVFNNDLYKSIYLHSRYFVSSDQGLEKSLSYLNNKNFDNDMNTFFEKEGIKNDIFGALLELSFPYVKNYFETKSNYKSCIEHSSQSTVYKEIQFNKRICSAKYFDLYFNEYTNFNSEISDHVNEFINTIKTNHQNEEIMNDFIKSILDLDDKIQTEFLSIFSLGLSEVPSDAFKNLGSLFLKNYFNFGNYEEYFVLGTKPRVAQIISTLVEVLNQDEFQNILHAEVSNLRKILMVIEIRYWLQHSTKNNKDKLDYLDKEINKFIMKISDYKFDMFEESLYVRKTSIKIYNCLKEIGTSDQFKNYLNNCINEKNYFRILNDLVMVTHDYLSVVYSMDSELENIIDIEKLKVFNEKVPPANEQQRLLKNVFENHLKKGKEELGKIGIRLDRPVDLLKLD